MKSASLRLASATLALVTASAAGAAVAPFTETFSSTLSGWTNQTATTATWSQNTVAGTYTATTSGAGGYYAITPVTNINSTTFTPGTPVVISTTFQITDVGSGGNEYYGIAAFGSNTTLGTAYLGDVQRTGSIRIVSLGGTNSGFTGGTATATNLTLAINTNYTLRFTGNYAGDGSIALTFALLDSGGNVLSSISANDTSPFTGTYFGIRNNVAAGTDTVVSATYDSFAISAPIPEPSSFAAVLGLAALGATGLRRRRR